MNRMKINLLMDEIIRDRDCTLNIARILGIIKKEIDDSIPMDAKVINFLSKEYKKSKSFENVFSKDEIYLIGKYLVENGVWRRHKHNDITEYSSLSIHLPYDADLSSTGTRVDVINKLIKES